MRKWFFLIFVSLAAIVVAIYSSNRPKKIGMCVMATGKYSKYAENMIASARKHFCKRHNVTYFVFTDQPIAKADDIVCVHQPRLGWPHDTLMRFKVYLDHKELLDEMDFIFALDADMLFVNEVGSEILSKLVATTHPGYVGKIGTYETDSRSTAHVKKTKGKTYFAGGFYGGSKNEFFKLIEESHHNICEDLKHDFIAVWHDESHLNRYFIDHPPTLVLSPSYCYPETWELPYQKLILALDKNHEEIRQ